MSYSDYVVDVPAAVAMAHRLCGLGNYTESEVVHLVASKFGLCQATSVWIVRNAYRRLVDNARGSSPDQAQHDMS